VKVLNLRKVSPVTLLQSIMRKNEIENIEITLLLEAMHACYGYDFRNYARASVKRRLRNFLAQTEYEHISECIPRLLYDEAFFSDLVYMFSIPVTEMFRDPGFFLAFKTQVIPYLKTYPHIKIWHAGCASGEEVYSLAIMLQEEGLETRTTIYATDFNETALEKAKNGIYPREHLQKFRSNYLNAGGKRNLSDYYHVQYESAMMDASLRERITFANHNLVTDAVFSEVHTILCRNVLIYFDRTLQNRVLHLFNDSLIEKGFLCLGSKESLQFSTVADKFDCLDQKESIYRKKD
jgi:chemotaxis protein methyltransferase CheR